MAAITQLDINLEGVAHCLSDKQLVVPVFQRPYAWGEEHVRDILLDIAAAMKENANEYFLGSIVLTEQKDGKLQVVDGQQRLATVSIMVAGVRDYMLSQGDQKRATQIESKYLHKIDLKTLEATPQLRLNVYDDAYYRSRILSVPKSEERKIKPTKESHKRLDRAARIVNRFIEDTVNTTKTPIPDLVDWLEFLEKRAKIIVVRVPDDRHAWVIFETLNDRGLALSISDLLKNYMFGVADDRVEEVQNYWGQMIGAIETVGDEDVILMYLRQVWASYNGLTRERELFDHVKRKIVSKQQAVEFGLALANDSKTYAALLNAQSEFWNPYGDTARYQIEVMMTLGLKQPRPLLLALISKFDPTEARKALVFLVSCSVRFTIVGQLGSTLLENLYADTGKLVRDGEIKTATALADYLLSKGVPNDKDFCSAFAIAKVSSTSHARYYLRTLQVVSAGKKEQEFVPNQNREIINLEHVLPQNIDPDNWKHFDQEQVHAFCNRIGNLALLKLKDNSVIGNKSFDLKKEVYKNSEYTLTQALAVEDIWTPAAIEKRQMSMAELALKAWPLKMQG